jgi:hypothetical protein
LTAETLSSPQITTLNSLYGGTGAGTARPTAGDQGAGQLQSLYQNIQPTSGSTSGSLYRMLRLQTNCIVRHLIIDYDGLITTFMTDCTLYYANAVLDSANQQNVGQLVNGLSGPASVFAYNLDLSMQTAGAQIEISGQSQNYNASLRSQPLWVAAGLSSDPGGFFDICLVESATQSTLNLIIGLEVQYIVP